MASSQWINVTPRLKTGVAVINAIETAKLRLLLNRIASSMQQAQATGQNSIPPIPFTEDEEAKLEKSLGLDLKDVRLAIDTSSLILQQAAYYMMKPDVMSTKLTEGLNVEAERAAVITNVWAANARQIVDSLRHRCVLSHQLSDVTWMLNVEASSDKSSKNKVPVAVLEFLLNSYGREDSSRVQVEMRKPQLQQLYHQMERMQAQLDALK